MTHMGERWASDRSVGIWYICTVGGYFVCRMISCLPGDPDGRLTAQAICDAHNAARAAGDETKTKSEGVPT
jgi:hypothetical protein